MSKKVNIYPQKPITCLNPPIWCIQTGVVAPIEIIRTCLMEKAIVEEILDNGDVITLTMDNYDKVNNVPVEVIPEVEEEVIPETTLEETKQEEATTEEDAQEEEPGEVDEDADAEWEAEYNKALEELLDGSDFAALSNKQKKNIEYKAKRAANEAVAIKKASAEEDVETIDIENL